MPSKTLIATSMAIARRIGKIPVLVGVCRGFVGKWLLLGSSLEQGQWWWVAVILVGSLLAAAYMIRLLSHAFTGAPETGVLRRVSGGMEWSALALALLSFALPGLLAET